MALLHRCSEYCQNSLHTKHLDLCDAEPTANPPATINYKMEISINI